MANKIYQLYPSGVGFSNDTIDYHGTSYAVAAGNNKQAHFLACNEIWATGPEHPQGIVENYQRGSGDPGEHRLWCGCRIYGGLNVRHGDGVRVIRAAMKDHLEESHPQ